MNTNKIVCLILCVYDIYIYVYIYVYNIYMNRHTLVYIYIINYIKSYH